MGEESKHRIVFGRPSAVWIVAIRRLSIDILLSVVALFSTVLLLAPAEFSKVASWSSSYLWLILLLTPLMILVRRVYRVSARYVGFLDILNASTVGFGLTVGLIITDQLVDNPIVWPTPFSGAIVFGFIFLFLWAGLRLLVKARQFPSLYVRNPRTDKDARTILIVGAGDAADMVCRELARLPRLRGRVVGFVDDDPTKQGSLIQGIPVLGRIQDVPTLVPRLGIDEILIAIPSATGPEMRRIFEFCNQTKAFLRTLPSFETIVNSRGSMVGHMRDFEVADLLRRDSVEKNLDGATNYLRGETVLITGGGGSIGSELARQVASHDPAGIILLGKGENSVFEIDQELRAGGYTNSHPVVCDVRDRQAVASVMNRFKPTIVFHAAAHKHVPLMEDVPIEAIRNNIFGTLISAEESVRVGAKRFILVSTDKAVNPSNVMGATKRIAEILVRSLSERSETMFSVVRFGNVLGSRGSLVPILRHQIRRGGPITITHPEMTRYFMTIPEASRLILQAGAQGGNGEIFILEMGEPVKIVDLAHDMIRMHGLVPGEDIAVKFTGIRPGEKLHEELAYDAEQLHPSGHPMINMVRNDRLIDWDWLRERLDHLRILCDEGETEAARAELMDLAWAKNLPPQAQVYIQDPTQ